MSYAETLEMCSTLESAGTASLSDDNAGVDKSVGEAPLMLHDTLKQSSTEEVFSDLGLGSEVRKGLVKLLSKGGCSDTVTGETRTKLESDLGTVSDDKS
ncbi:hypothetical protein EHS25_001186 [Saitozyma podzolica]|uniref:Uncharacterized protein n=1 Tax=Saitozyma podzolica TaxID=1890683 RepID=A0A427YHF7_9TREE|nr:hypothetical protein EHS25_001186 [Saitozyma podzolica]